MSLFIYLRFKFIYFIPEPMNAISSTILYRLLADKTFDFVNAATHEKSVNVRE